MLGMVFGLIFGIALVFLADALDTRVRSSDEIQEHLGMPLLARVPEPPRKPHGRQRLPTLETPRGPDAEAFRMLATNLHLVTIGSDTSKILVTSALRGEGKSATAANLAVAFARTGRRVALVDLDLRSPSIDRLFGLAPDRPGVTDLALGRITLEDALVRIPVLERDPSLADVATNGGGRAILEVLPSGPLPPNPAEFIASGETVADVLQQLAVRADLVLVDAPPVLEVSDVMTLMTDVDGVLIVTRIGRTARPVLDELRRVLDRAPTRKLGFAATGAKAEEGYPHPYAYSSSHRDEHDRDTQARAT